MDIKNLFPINIFLKKASNHLKIQEYIDNEIFSKYLEVGYNSTQCNVFSDYFPGAPAIDQKIMSELYQTDIETFLEKIGFDKNEIWNIHCYFWYNITGENGWQESHDHIGGPLPVQFSGIHYIKFDKNEHTPVSFEHPQAQILRSVCPSMNKNKVPALFKLLQTYPNIEEGDLIIFPSYLRHQVSIQRSKKDRITVSFNISVTD